MRHATLTKETKTHSASAGSEGIAITPPTYGIDVVDSQPIQAMPAYSQEYQSLNSSTLLAREGIIQKQRENKTGLPDNLKAGLENLSGLSMDDVRVHYNSSKPAQLQALAYTQGTNIYLGSGQEKHLPHEGWHVVQQMEDRVKPTVQVAGEQVNDDIGLEREAGVMGEKALQLQSDMFGSLAQATQAVMAIIQRQLLPVARHREIVVDAAKKLDDPVKATDTQWIQAIYKELKGEGEPAADKCVDKLKKQGLIDEGDWRLIQKDFKLYRTTEGKKFDLYERHNTPRLYNEQIAEKWVASLIENRIKDLYSTLEGFQGHADQVQLQITTLVRHYEEGYFKQDAFNKYKKKIINELKINRQRSNLDIPKRVYTFDGNSTVTI